VGCGATEWILAGDVVHTNQPPNHHISTSLTVGPGCVARPPNLIHRAPLRCYRALWYPTTPPTPLLTSHTLRSVGWFVVLWIIFSGSSLTLVHGIEKVGQPVLWSTCVRHTLTHHLASRLTLSLTAHLHVHHTLNPLAVHSTPTGHKRREWVSEWVSGCPGQRE
jgi:hypothetical protein